MTTTDATLPPWRLVPLRPEYNQSETHPTAPDLYYARWTFRTFAHMCDDLDHLFVVPLTAHDVEVLRVASNLCHQTGRVRPNDVAELSCHPTLKTVLSGHMEWFCKVADASPKDVLEPLRTPEQLWSCLVRSGRVRTFLNATCATETDLVLRPWNATINHNNEYRAFVRDGRLVGVSQQQVHHPMALPVNGVAVLSAVQQWLLRWDPLPHRNTVLDLWVDANGKAHLIECNPWRWGSGSALFTWQELEEADPTTPELRLRDPES